MKKWTTGFALTILIAACGDNGHGSDANMYDTTVHDASGVAATRDSVTTAMAKDSAAIQKDSSKGGAQSNSAAASGGGVPKGTIDSGMTNAGAQKHHKHK